MHWFPPACGGARGGDRRESFCEDIYNCSTNGSYAGTYVTLYLVCYNHPEAACRCAVDDGKVYGGEDHGKTTYPAD